MNTLRRTHVCQMSTKDPFLVFVTATLEKNLKKMKKVMAMIKQKMRNLICSIYINIIPRKNLVP